MGCLGLGDFMEERCWYFLGHRDLIREIVSYQDEVYMINQEIYRLRHDNGNNAEEINVLSDRSNEYFRQIFLMEQEVRERVLNGLKKMPVDVNITVLGSDNFQDSVFSYYESGTHMSFSDLRISKDREEMLVHIKSDGVNIIDIMDGCGKIVLDRSRMDFSLMVVPINIGDKILYDI